jgi:uncharacterized protein (TIGR03546 family)
MILPRPFKKILAIFRGGVSPVIIFLSVLFGFWFGLMPGWSGLHTILIILMLILNIHIGIFLLSAGVGKALCFAAAPVLYHIGVGVQDYLAGLLNLLASVPILGITNFNRYSVAGALVVGPVVGGIAGLIMARAVIGFRRSMLKFEDGSEKFRKWYSNRWVRIFDRLLIGKRTKDAKSMFTSKAKIVRKAGIGLAVIVLAISVTVSALVKDNVVKDYAAQTMTRANGAEVNLENLNLSLLAGAVSASGIQVTDEEKPENNKIAIDKISADASVYDLLLGRVVMEDVEVSNVKFDQKRQTPGKVVEKTVEEKPSVFDPCNYDIDVTDISKLEKYFKDAKALKERLQQISKWLPAGGEKTATQPKEIPQEYLEYLQVEASVPPSPRLLARKILADKVEIPSELFGNSKILLTNISDAVQSAGLPVTFEMKSNDTPAYISITLDFSTKDKNPKICGEFTGFDLTKMQSGLNSNTGLTFESGTATGTIDGMISKDSIDMAIDFTIDNMKAKGQGEGILGLDAKTTSEALAALQNLHTTIRVVGPVTEPRLAFDIKGLQEEFKTALIKAGKERLSQEIDKQIDEQIEKNLGDKAPDELKETLKKSKDLLDGLGGMLQDKKEDE